MDWRGQAGSPLPGGPAVTNLAVDNEMRLDSGCEGRAAGLPEMKCEVWEQEESQGWLQGFGLHNGDDEWLLAEMERTPKEQSQFCQWNWSSIWFLGLEARHTLPSKPGEVPESPEKAWVALCGARGDKPPGRGEAKWEVGGSRGRCGWDTPDRRDSVHSDPALLGVWVWPEPRDCLGVTAGDRGR